MTPNQGPPIRVIVVDDHDLVRRSVKTFLQTAGDIVVCGEAAAGREAEQVAADTEPDVAIIDLRLGGDSGVLTGREIRARRAATHVILLTSSTDEEAAFAAMLAGAEGYLVKQLGGMDLAGAVRTAAHGGRCSEAPSPAALERLRVRASSALDAAGAGAGPAGPHTGSRLLELVIAGRTNREIGNILGLEEAVIQARISAIVSDLSHMPRGSSRHEPGRPTAYPG